VATHGAVKVDIVATLSVPGCGTRMKNALLMKLYILERHFAASPEYILVYSKKQHNAGVREEITVTGLSSS
jgi:hypothetical protein